ncbi:MAG: T9SS type A sorting domain-containing protein [Bacteroidota bacterium]|nr:T9SS type A sorting domain-containing protein [Bacteroidota bacterium]MDX5431567.1 T9SS type A sorting domain-containing protein [Bacteroidota bacterium]MDX5470288.1 T9SS type A sorting domain-containing protein [Bacteroidota bacterium]
MRKLFLTIFTASVAAFSTAQSVSTVGGIYGNNGFQPFNGSVASVPIAGPFGICTDTSGYIYFSDNQNHRISVLDLQGNIYNKCGYIGDPSMGGTGYINANSSLAKFNQPNGMVVDQTNTVYICDYANNTIRKMPIIGGVPQGLTVSTFAGEDAGVNSGGDHVDATGLAARFNGPIDITVDANGNFYVADNWNEVIRKITPGGVVTTLCGGVGQTGDVDDTGLAARFNNILGVEMLDNTYLLVADAFNNKIRKVNVNTGEVTTFAGTGATGHQDGNVSTAQFNAPSGLAVDSYGNVYVSEGGSSQSNVIRKIDVNGNVTTIAGAYQSGTNYADGPGTDSRFKRPTHMTFNSDKSVLYVTDLDTNTSRAIDLRPIARFSASPSSTNTGVPVQLTDNSFGDPTSWKWEITPSTGFTLENGTSLTSQNPLLKFNVATTYSVKLTVTNAWGSGDTTRNNYINISNINTTDPPVADFVASDSIIVVNDVVTFTDMSLNSPNQWQWNIIPITHQYMNGTSATSQNPQVKFTGVGNYSVFLKAINNNGDNVKAKNNYIQVSPLGVKQIDFNTLLSVYPNPNSGSFTLHFDEAFEHQGLDVVLFDMNGKEIQHHTMEGHELNVDDLKAGIYLVRVSDGANTFNQKVVVR